MVHGVAGVEGTGQAGVRPIEDTESGGDCDFHAPSWGHCRQNHNLVKMLGDRAGGLQPLYNPGEGVERGRTVALRGTGRADSCCWEGKDHEEHQMWSSGGRGLNRYRGEPSNSLPGHGEPNGLNLF